ncbi:MAG: O-antigen ligase family protein [bacterium]
MATAKTRIERVMDPHPPLVNMRFWLTFMSLAAITFMLTSMTNNLDEIKITLLHFLGPVLLGLSLYSVAKNQQHLPPTAMNYWLLAHVGLAILSVALMDFRWIGYISLLTLFCFLGFYFSVAGSIRSLPRLHLALVLCTIIVFITTFLGLLHYVGFFKFIYMTVYQGRPASTNDLHGLVYTLAENPEMFSTILNRDFYCAYLVMYFPLALGMMLMSNRLIEKILGMVTVVTSLTCIFLTGSKDGWGALMAVMALFGLMYFRYYHHGTLNKKYLATWALGLGIILSTVALFNVEDLGRNFKSLSRSVESRQVMWGGAWKEFKDFPILGSGPGSYRVYFPRYRSPNYHLHDISNVTLSAHNEFLNFLCENGILGFTAWMGFIISGLWMAFKELRSSPNREVRFYQISLFCAVVGYCLVNIFSPNGRWIIGGIQFWILMGMLGAGIQLERQPTKLISRQTAIIPPWNQALRWTGVGMVVVLGAVSWFYGVRYFVGAIWNNDGLVLLPPREADEQDTPASRAARTAAIPFFEKALNWSPTSKQPQYPNHSNPPLVGDFLNWLLKGNPTFITSHYKLAHCYHGIGDYENALKVYAQLQKYAPDYSEIHYNLGVVYASLGRMEESLKEFQRAGEMSNKPEVKFMVMKAYDNLDRFHEAREEAAKVLKVDPNRYYDSKDREEARRAIEVAKIRYAAYSILLEEYDKAIPALLELHQANPGDQRFTWEIIELYRKSGRQEDLVKFLQAVLETNPLDLRLREQLARQLRLVGEKEQAYEQFQKLSHVLPTRQEMAFSAGKLALELGRLDDSSYYLNRVLAQDNTTSWGIQAKDLLEQFKNPSKVLIMNP